MNSNIIEGKWKQMRGEVKRWWGKLTDDDLDGVLGEGCRFLLKRSLARAEDLTMIEATGSLQ